jgi:hypothetical protein
VGGRQSPLRPGDLASVDWQNRVHFYAIAQAVNISPATTKRKWATARLWLHHAMSNDVQV